MSVYFKQHPTVTAHSAITDPEDYISIAAHGDDITLSVAVSDDTGISYQWQRRERVTSYTGYGRKLTPFEWVDIPGETSEDLAITSIDESYLNVGIRCMLNSGLTSYQTVIEVDPRNGPAIITGPYNLKATPGISLESFVGVRANAGARAHTYVVSDDAVTPSNPTGRVSRGNVYIGDSVSVTGTYVIPEGTSFPITLGVEVSDQYGGEVAPFVIAEEDGDRVMTVEQDPDAGNWFGYRRSVPGAAAPGEYGALDYYNISTEERTYFFEMFRVAVAGNSAGLVQFRAYPYEPLSGVSEITVTESGGEDATLVWDAVNNAYQVINQDFADAIAAGVGSDVTLAFEI